MTLANDQAPTREFGLTRVFDAPRDLWERFVLAFQCHPEVRQEDFESWLIGHANEIAAASNASVEQLRKDTQYYGPTLAACAKQAFTEWLASVGL